jgi:ubiquinone/menaquinone biosynthesis C-methylase UbiE
MTTINEAAWQQRYRELRASGEIGWTGATSYAHKQSRIEAALRAHPIPAPARFLELGCGAGNITVWMAEQGYEAYGIDLVPEAIAWARERAAEANVAAVFQVGNIANMSGFPDNFFDIIFDGDCFHMITGPTRPACFAEVARVLRPGGVFTTGSNARNTEIHERVEMNAGAYFDTVSRCIFVEGRREYIILTEQELVEDVTAAGFEVTGCDRRPRIGGQPFLDYWFNLHLTKR